MTSTDNNDIILFWVDEHGWIIKTMPLYYNTILGHEVFVSRKFVYRIASTYGEMFANLENPLNVLIRIDAVCDFRNRQSLA